MLCLLMPSDSEKLLARLEKQEQRIRQLESEMKLVRANRNKTEDELETSRKIKKKHSSFKMPFTFTGFITTTGVLGIIVALVAFFTYAISNNWIGPTVQVLIGVIVGLVLLILGWSLYSNHPYWANAAIGGSVLVEHLTVGFGVWYYDILNPYAAFAGLLVLTAVGVALAMKKNSLLIAYFAILGGFAMPLVAHVYQQHILMFSFLLVLGLGVLALSYSKNWTSLRLISFFAVAGYEWANYTSFGAELSSTDMSPELSLVFLALFFLLYNLNSIVYSIRREQHIAVLDVLVLNLNTFVSALLCASILLTYTEPVSRKVLGSIFVGVSFIFLLEVYIVRSFERANTQPTLYSLLSSGIILLNAGLIFIFSTGDFLRFIILTLPQWVLYSMLAKKTKDNTFYDVFAQIFLGLSLIWWLVYLWPDGLEQASFALLGMILVSICMAWLLLKEVHKQAYSVIAVLLGFSLCYSIAAYIPLLTEVEPLVETTILSGLWLLYTLTLFITCRRMSTLKPVSNFAFGLLIVSLLKIATYDLWLLDGITRIIGFAGFGVLLLVGGLMLKNDAQ